MEDIFKRSLLALTILLLVNCVSSDVTTTIEGITVSYKEGKVNCDSLACPQETDVCRVTKIFDPNDDKNFLRIRKCIDSNGVVLKKEKFSEPTGNFNHTLTITMEGKQNGKIIFSEPKPEDE